MTKYCFPCKYYRQGQCKSPIIKGMVHCEIKEFSKETKKGDKAMRQCPQCKGIINLNEHSYYVEKVGQRKRYFHEHCLPVYIAKRINRFTDKEISADCPFIGQFIKEFYNHKKGAKR